MTNRDDDRNMRGRYDRDDRDMNRERMRYGDDSRGRSDDRSSEDWAHRQAGGYRNADSGWHDGDTSGRMDERYRNDRSYDMDRDQRGSSTGNSYQRGLGGSGSYNPDRQMGNQDRGGMSGLGYDGPGYGRMSAGESYGSTGGQGYASQSGQGYGRMGAQRSDSMGGREGYGGMPERNRDFDQPGMGYGVYGNRDMGHSSGESRSTYGDRDMGNLERDPYGRGSTMRSQGSSGMFSGMGMGGQDQAGQGSMGQSSMGQGSGRQGQHYGRGPKSYQRSDDRIREEINEQLTYHHDVDATDIEVQVQGGEVTLTGTVQDRRQKRLAEDIAEEIRGVRDVHNHIRVQQGMGGMHGSMQGGHMQGGTMVVAPAHTGEVRHDDSGGLSGHSGAGPMSTTQMSGGDSTNMTTPGTTTGSNPGATIEPMHSLDSGNKPDNKSGNER